MTIRDDALRALDKRRAGEIEQRQFDARNHEREARRAVAEICGLGWWTRAFTDRIEVRTRNQSEEEWRGWVNVDGELAFYVTREREQIRGEDYGGVTDGYVWDMIVSFDGARVRNLADLGAALERRDADDG